MNGQFEVVIISGKGGTGKTTLTSSLAELIPDKVICDADVDAADMFLILKPELIKENPFKGKSIAIINQDKCVSCGICEKVCRFNAVDAEETDEKIKYTVNPYSCDGCTFCALACPAKAINMEQQTVGDWFISKTEAGTLIHAKLKPGAENSGNLVTMVKHQAHLKAKEEGLNFILVDGPPGIGCPVTSAISGASLAIIVTEPTFSGIHDLERVYDLSLHFKVPAAVVINKYDLNRENTLHIESYAKEKGIKIIGKIPFSPCVVDSIAEAKTPMTKCPEIAKTINNIYKEISVFRKRL
ncbi:MAG: (4Fe-4S)-binding protein [Spirochaetes bacterium]|nr:MAG: (4Fe-4S)-binding protein [Spirochaetota bacterium]